MDTSIMHRMFLRKSNKANAALAANEDNSSRDACPPHVGPGDFSWRTKDSIVIRDTIATSVDSKVKNETSPLAVHVHDKDHGDCHSDQEKDIEISKEIANLDLAGNLLLQRGEYVQAFLKLERALKLKVNHPQFEKSVFQLDNHDKAGNQKGRMLASYAFDINNDAYLKQKAGEQSTEETLAAYLQALEIKQDILGPSHPSIAITLTNIGAVFVRRKDFRPALKAYNRAYKILLARLGPNHLDMSTVLSNIADVYTRTKKCDKALAFYRQALDIRWRLCPSDPKVVKIMERIASLETGPQGTGDDDFSDGDYEEDGQNYGQEETDEDLHISIEEIEREMVVEIQALENSFFSSKDDDKASH